MVDIQTMFNRARIDDRQINELIGLSRGLIADGKVTTNEAEFLRGWLVASADSTANPVILNLLNKVSAWLKDRNLDEEESAELLAILQSFTGGNIEVGELLKSSLAFLDDPVPEIFFPEKRFCFTGTFAFGSRRECEKAVEQKGATHGALTLKTDYLIIGIYMTESWAHSAYGRKIEKAIEYKSNYKIPAIISEKDWIKYIN